MFFRNFAITNFIVKNRSAAGLNFALFALSFFLVSCGLKLNEKNKDTNESAKVKSAQCLNQSISDLKLFLKGDASDQVVTQSFGCLENVFIAFKDNIRGQDKNVFTPKEIADFVSVNFFSDGTTLSPAFVTEIMKLKVALFGGSETLIKKQEIDLVVSLISRFTPQLVKLNPHMKIINMQWQPAAEQAQILESEKQFQLAKVEFSKFIVQVLSEFKAGGREYKIDDVLNLVVEAAKFTKSAEGTIDTIKKSRVFFKRFKKHLIGGNNSIQGDDWEKLALTLSEAYFQALRYQYFLNPLDETQVEEKWSVYQKIGLDLSALVEKLLNAKETQALTNEEILDLIEPLAEIFPELQVNAPLLDGLGDLKVMILGESKLGNRGWAKSDFKALEKKIPDLFKNISILFKEFDLLSAKKNTTLAYSDFLIKEAKVQGAIYQLSQLIEGRYDLKSLKNLTENLSSSLLKANLSMPPKFDSLFKVILAGQTVLTGEASSVLGGPQLKILFNVGIRGYLNYVEYNLFLSAYSSNDPRFAHNLIRLWPKVKTTLSFNLSQKGSHLITTDELTNLILVLQEEKYISTKIRKTSLNALFSSLWTHIFNDPNLRLQDVLQPGLNEVVLTQISSELEIYLQNQKNISEMFISGSPIFQSDLVAQLNRQLQNSKNLSESTGLSEMLQFINPFTPLNFDSRGFLKILTSDLGQYVYSDLEKSNLSRAISRLITRAYAKDLGRVNSLIGVSLDEVELAYAQLKSVAVDLEAVEESNLTFISSRFREANLFLAPSNGDAIADFKELHQLIMQMFSGIQRAGVVKQEIVALCLPGTVVKDLKSRSTISEDCLLQAYLDETNAFGSMPNFTSMKSTYKPEQLKEFYLSLLKAAGHVQNPEKLVYFADADLFPHVVQYIEMIFATHDLDKDGFLNKEEATKAFPVFKALLKELVVSYKQIKEEDLLGVFVYILKNGRPPNPKNLGELLKFVAFIRDKDQKGWDIQATRIDLGRIFNFIADATKPVTSP